jgi:uncharacterized protein (DUF983 family)
VPSLLEIAADVRPFAALRERNVLENHLYSEGGVKMLIQRFGGGNWLVFGLLLGLGLLVVADSALAQAQYMGDEAFCALCHQDKYDTYIQSGHPWKIQRTQGQVPAADTWPHSPVPPLPASLPNGWADVEYVIGNFFWKARYIQRDGYIHTGTAQQPNVQWNLQTRTWSTYNTGTLKPFNCGPCHTTGYDPAGNQHGLPGLIGTWAQDGVRCEACHGAGGPHMGGQNAKDCMDCHVREQTTKDVIPWSGGFTRHQTQGNDLAHSPHKGFHCTECHDPHKSVVYGLGGLTKQCTDCHQKRVRGFMGVAVQCVDCHMPMMTKSAVSVSTYQADVRGHLFQIMTQPISREQNNAGGFWNQDPDGKAWITLDYACKQCHPNLTLEQAADYAKYIHRITEMLDLTINGDDELQSVNKGAPVKVDFSVKAGAKEGMMAEWWVLCQGPKGWTSWNGKKWVPGIRAWRKSAPLADVPNQNVLNSTRLATGYYTYWLGIYPTDESENVVSVPLYVKKR